MLGLPTGKESACNAGFDSWVRKIPWRKKWQSTTVSLPGNPTDRGAWWATVQGLLRVIQDSVTIQQNILHIIYIDNTYVCEWIIYLDGCYIWIIHIYIWMDHIYIYIYIYG